MEKKLLCGISQRHFQGKISSQKVLFIRGKLINSFYEKFFAVFPRHRRENDFQSEIIKNCIIFCTDIVSNGLVKAPQPDVLEMPYRPPLLGADEPGENAVTIRLGGPTCLSGDIIGDYSFSEPLKYGDILMFGDMAIYTTCKNNTFNGMPLPDIWLRHGDKTMERLTDFGYEDFKGRLGRCRK